MNTYSSREFDRHTAEILDEAARDGPIRIDKGKRPRTLLIPCHDWREGEEVSDFMRRKGRELAAKGAI